jgi:hypothetical protein
LASLFDGSDGLKFFPYHSGSSELEFASHFDFLEKWIYLGQPFFNNVYRKLVLKLNQIALDKWHVE